MAHGPADTVLVVNDDLGTTLDAPRSQVPALLRSGWKVLDQPSTRPPNGADTYKAWVEFARSLGVEVPVLGMTKSEIRAACEKAVAAKKSPTRTRSTTPRSPRGNDDTSTPSKED